MQIIIPWARQTTPNLAKPVSLLDSFDGITVAEKVCSDLNSIDSNANIQVIGLRSDSEIGQIERLFEVFLDNKKFAFKHLLKPTQGAACTVLLSLTSVKLNEPLLIINGDQTFYSGLGKAVSSLQNLDCDAGVLTMQTVHPRWSYVIKDDHGIVSEVCEKEIVSKDAIAGVYYFREATYFLKAAQSMISKRDKKFGAYFIGPSLNQLILEGMTVGSVDIADLGIEYKSYAV